MKIITARKFFCFLFLLVLIGMQVSVCSFAVAESEAKKEEIFDINTIASQEEVQEFINSISSSTKNKIVSAIKNYDVLKVTCEKKYLPVDSAEAADAVVKSIFFDVKNKESGEYAGRIICVYWSWLDKKPIIRGEDRISLGWDSKRFIYESDSFYAEDYWRDEETDEWSVSGNYNSLATANQGLIEHWCNLKKFKNHVGGAVLFKLTPTNIQMTESETDRLQINYEHQFEKFVSIVSVVSVAVLVGAAILVTTIKRRRKNS